MRVLILSIYHDPEPIPKTGELARALKARGHQVEVVTAFPHYPTGQVYPGYRLALWRREVRQGVPILRTYIYPYHGARAALRMVNYVTWMFSSMLAAVLTSPCDVMYVWHPPLTVGVSAWVIARLKRVKYVYDVQDLWPESALASGLLEPGFLVGMLQRLARWVYARAPRILVVSEQARAHLVGMGVPESKIAIARHWVDEGIFLAPPTGRDVRSELGIGNRFCVMFAGNLGMVQGLETIVEAAERLKDRRDILFVLVGDGADRPRLERDVHGRGLGNVIFAGSHPASAMPDFFAAADALLVHLRRSAISENAIPTKLLAYLAGGRPIVCAVDGAAAEVVTAAEAGVVTPPGDAGALADAVVQLAARPRATLDAMGTRARQYFVLRFDREQTISCYERELAALAGRDDACRA